MEKEWIYKEQRNQIVVKSNDLIQKTRFTLNTEQQKLILYLISKIKPTDTEFQSYEFTVVDYLKIIGNSKGGETYKTIKESLKVLADKSMWIYNEQNEHVLVRWLQNLKINEQTGIITIRLDEELKPYLLQIKDKYTQYELIYTFSLKSKYSIRAYEYFNSKHYNKSIPYTFTISLNEFKQRVGAENYTVYRDLKRRVINPIVEELNAYTDKNIKIEPIITGRKTTDLQITINTKGLIERMEILSQIEQRFDNNQISLYDVCAEIAEGVE